MAEVNFNLLFVYILLLLDAGLILNYFVEFAQVFIQETKKLFCDG